MDDLRDLAPSFMLDAGLPSARLPGQEDEAPGFWSATGAAAARFLADGQTLPGRAALPDEFFIGRDFVEENAPAQINLWDAAVEQMWMSQDLERFGRRVATMAPDPEFRWTEELFEKYAGDLPEPYWSLLEGAQSERQLAFMAENARKKLASAETLAGAHWSTALGLSFAAGAVDPLAFTADALTLGGARAVNLAGLGMRVGMRNARLATAVESGVALSASVGGYTALQSNFNPEITPEVILFATAAGGVLGGGVQALAGARRGISPEIDAQLELATLERSVARSAQAMEAQANGLELTEKGRAALSEASKAPEALLVSNRTAASKFEEDIVAKRIAQGADEAQARSEAAVEARVYEGLANRGRIDLEEVRGLLSGWRDDVGVEVRPGRGPAPRFEQLPRDIQGRVVERLSGRKLADGETPSEALAAFRRSNGDGAEDRLTDAIAEVAGVPRGQYDPATGRTILFSGDQTPATPFHEQGHRITDLLGRVAAKTDSPELKADLDAMLDFAGQGKTKFTTFEDLWARTPEADEGLEALAKAWERWLREGVAPSDALGRAFAWLREMLEEVYRSLDELGEPLTDEMRGVFRRMTTGEERVIRPAEEVLSAEDAIRAAEERAPRLLDKDAVEADREGFVERVSEALIEQARRRGLGDGPFSLTGPSSRSPTDTPEFKRWFGDSKVVDENGKPLVVYHGTAQEFDAFSSAKIGSANDAGFLGSGFYFGSREMALGYSGGSGQVLPVYLKMDKPYRLNSFGLEGRVDELPRDLQSGVRKRIENDHDLFIDKIEYDDGFSIEILALRSSPDDVEGAQARFSHLVSEEIRSKGHDGVIGETLEGTEYIVFEPTQIKSVNNRGAFDPSDDRFLYSLTGPQRSPQAILKDAKEAADHIADALARGEAVSTNMRLPEDGLSQGNVFAGERLGLDPERLAGFVSESPEGAALASPQAPNTPPEGAATHPQGEGPSFAQLMHAEAEQTAKRTQFATVRFSVASALKSSSNAITRKLGTLLVEDAVGNADGSKVAFGTTEVLAANRRVVEADLYRIAKPAFLNWRKAGGQSGRRDAETFWREVGKAVRRPSGRHTDDPHINATANRLRTILANTLKNAKEWGVRGFEDVAENETYLARIFDHQAVDAALVKFGEDGVARVVAAAIRQASVEMSFEDAMRIGRAYIRSVRRQRYGAEISTALGGENKSMLLAILREELGESVTDADIRQIVARVSPDNDSGRISRAKRRLDLDETAKIEIRNKQTGEFEILRYEDLLENNAEVIFHSYIRQVMGAAHLHQTLEKFRLPGEEAAPSWDRVIQAVRETATGPRDTLDKELRLLELVRKTIMGLPINEQTLAVKTAQVVRDFNFIRVMNQVGFAQLAEIGNALGHMGVRAFLQASPALGGVLRQAKTGRLSNELLSELDLALAFTTERLRRPMTVRVDDLGSTESRLLGRSQQLLRYGKNITGDVSGMIAVNQVTRALAGAGMANRFANHAFSFTLPHRRRLANLGLTETQFERIAAQMRDHVERRGGVKRLNLNKWEDTEARALFELALDRWMRRIVQENDIGNLPAWMTTELGKSVFQFRSFMLGAYEKQLLMGLSVRDANMAQAFLASMFFGMLAYIGQTHLNAAARGDRDDYLERRLAEDEIAKAAFQRAGFASIIPGVVDTAVYPLGIDPVFAYGRSTGLATGLVAGNPTVDFVDNAQDTMRAIVAPHLNSDYEYSQEDHRAVKALLPFQNAMIIRQLLDAMGEDLPRKSDPSKP